MAVIGFHSSIDSLNTDRFGGSNNTALDGSLSIHMIDPGPATEIT